MDGLYGVYLSFSSGTDPTPVLDVARSRDYYGLLEKNNTHYLASTISDVVNIEYMGEGEKIGIQFYDEVTKLEISSIDRPKKEYIYLFGILLLILTFFTQRKKLNSLS